MARTKKEHWQDWQQRPHVIERRKQWNRDNRAWWRAYHKQYYYGTPEAKEYWLAYQRKYQKAYRARKKLERELEHARINKDTTELTTNDPLTAGKTDKAD